MMHVSTFKSFVVKIKSIVFLFLIAPGVFAKITFDVESSFVI